MFIAAVYHRTYVLVKGNLGLLGDGQDARAAPALPDVRQWRHPLGFGRLCGDGLSVSVPCCSKSPLFSWVTFSLNN